MCYNFASNVFFFLIIPSNHEVAVVDIPLIFFFSLSHDYVSKCQQQKKFHKMCRINVKHSLC